MKAVVASIFFLALAVSMASSIAQARDYGNHNCGIFVIRAQNVSTGGSGNFLTAQVAVSKSLIDQDFKNPQVHILGSEDVSPTGIEERGNYLVYTFDKYARGITYWGNSASVVAFISNGIDRAFDNNDNVILIRDYNWQYTNPNCHY